MKKQNGKSNVSSDIENVDVVNGHQYHVLWKGYQITEATWEPESVFDHAQETLQPYKEYHGLNKKV